MKWFLILLAIGLTASEKLDRTYLPPPGAQFAGGNPGDIQAPLEPSNLRQPGTIPIGSNLPGLQDYGDNVQPSQVPVTTTSYAFTQTTTYPPIEGFETTVVPINPVTGLPIQNLGQTSYQQSNQNVPGFIQNVNQLVPGYDANLQPGFISQGSVSGSQPVNIGGPSYTQVGNQQPQPGVVTPAGNNQLLPGALQQNDINKGYTQYPGDQQYPNQNVPGSGSQLPSNNQGSIQYPSGHDISGQHSPISPTMSPQQITSANLPGDQYIEIGHKGPLIEEYPQGTYSGQPINVQDFKNPQFTKGQIGQDGSLVQQPITGNQNTFSPGPTSGKSTYQPGQGYNSVTSTTPIPEYTSSTKAYSSTGPIIRPERPQAAGDRNAVILNYENVRTPNGYSYSYDTSNGIHADETGTVGDGTRAQGGYSYIGDDGKVYSVTYTADENGFQPRGDHIPTAPPIPEAIQKVIEQAAKDKAAGIIDDGSYDEAKYGYKNYQRPVNYRRPQTQSTGVLNNNRRNQVGKDMARPISGISDEYNNQDQFNDNISTDGNRIKPTEYSPRRPSDQNTENESSGLNKNLNPETAEQPTNNNEKIKGSKNNSDQPGGSGLEDNKTQYPGTVIEDKQNTAIYPDNEAAKESDFENGDRQDTVKGSPDYYRPSQTLLTSNNDFPTISTGKQAQNSKIKGNRRPDIASNKRPQNGENSNQGDIDDFVGQNNANVQNPRQEIKQQIDENGYYYDQTQFSTRFKGQNLPSNTDFIRHNGQGSTVRPFQTPEVYNQQFENKPNREQFKNQQSTTLKPFMTSRVTSPMDNSYTDYDDGEYHGSNQNIDDDGISTTKKPSNRRRPSQPIRTTSSPQYTPFGQRTRVTEKGTVAPIQETDYYNTIQPSYNYGSTTPLPSQESRFSSTEIPKKTMDQRQRRPSTSRRPGTTTAVGLPVSPSKPRTELPDYRYQTTSSSLDYPTSTASPGYSTKGTQPGYDSRLPYGQTGSTAQNYPTYSTTSSTVAPLPGYQSSSATFIPSGVSGTYQAPTIGPYQTRQEYEPGQYSTTTVPQRPTPTSFTPGTYPTSTPGYYKTTYQQGPDSTHTTVRPGLIPGYQYGTTAAGPSSTGPYQTSNQYGSSIPDYATTSTPGVSPNFGSPIDTGSSGSYYSQPSPSGYQYDPPGSVYPTTGSPSTIGTTPGSSMPSTTPSRPYQEYATTQRPIYPSTQSVYGQSPIVDGFGRPIDSQQQPGYSYIGQEPSQYPGTQFIDGTFRGPGGLNGAPTGATLNDNLRPMYGDQSSNYPGYYGQPQIVGEDFSGPKQPQRFDPQTGYHY